MKRVLLAATILAASRIVLLPAPALAQSAGTSGATDGAAPVSHHHRKHRHHAAVAAAPDAAAATSVADAAPAADPVPVPAASHALSPLAAMAMVRLPDTGTQVAGAGEGLTPLGAIRAGNEDGSIPAWTGGLVGRATGVSARLRADPFADERPLFRITAQNVDRYAGKLAAGTVAMIKTLHGYHVDVYPTHRTAAAPQFIYDNAIANEGRAHLSHNGESVEGEALSIPFPIPHNGPEAMWNELHRWRASEITRTVTSVISTQSGDYALQRWREEALLPYNTVGFKNPRNLDFMFRQEVLAPPRDAGALTLVLNHEDPYQQPREAWSYNPGERRVRRAPEIDYDTPLIDTDGLATVDDYDLFNGALDRYTWTLVGRREMYVPYNTNKLQDASVRYTDLVGREALNPDYIRFELHRVWEVEAKLKPEFRHIYTRRTLYLDEDSWQALISDRYDGRGNLWRTAMAFPLQHPELPLFEADGYEFVDLYQHRYMAQGLHSQESVQPTYNVGLLTPRDFTADALRQMGHR